MYRDTEKQWLIFIFDGKPLQKRSRTNHEKWKNFEGEIEFPADENELSGWGTLTILTLTTSRAARLLNIEMKSFWFLKNYFPQ